MLGQRLDAALIQLVDLAHAWIPRATPTRSALAEARIVSHRGERQQDRDENTFAAFDPLVGSGVWGLECDLRWTRDLVPMVYHDVNFQRLHDDPTPLAALSAAEVQQRHPQIPRLSEFVARYGKHFHLMIELKAEPYPAADAQTRELLRILNLGATQGFHLICLNPDFLDSLPGLPVTHTVNVARFNSRQLSTDALSKGRAGLAGHYQLLTNAQVRAHRAAGQHIGSGYPASSSVLRRELNRGVQWIFSNQALAMQRELDRLRIRAGLPVPNSNA